MTLTDDEAREIFGTIMELLRKADARDVVEGIAETRRVGIEEEIAKDQIAKSKRSEYKEVAGVRRRPPNDLEMLRSALDVLNQRLIVLPSLADAIRKRLGPIEILWRIDTEFSSVEDYPEASLRDLQPNGVDEVRSLVKVIEQLLGSSQGER